MLFLWHKFNFRTQSGHSEASFSFFWREIGRSEPLFFMKAFSISLQVNHLMFDRIFVQDSYFHKLTQPQSSIFNSSKT